MASTQRVRSRSPKKPLCDRTKENQSPTRKIERTMPTTEIINEKVVQISIEASHIKAVQRIEKEAFWNSPAEHIPTLREGPALDTSITVEGAKLQAATEYEDPNIREDLKKAAQVQPLVTSTEVQSNKSPGTSGANSPRPGIEKPESLSILKLGQEMEELVLGEDNCAVSGVGLGGMKSGNDIFRKSSLQNGKLRPQKARLPSWKAAATEPEAKIDESLRKIQNFLATIQEEVNDLNTAERNSKFKLFMDASKQIVSAWPLLNGDLFQGLEGQLLSEEVDCIHAIHLAWDKDSTRNNGFLDQGLDMATHCEEFGKQWETLTGRDMGITRKRKPSSAADRKHMEKTDSNEKMEYIPPVVVSISTPNVKDALKNPQINLSLQNNIKNDSGSIHDPPKLEDRTIAPLSQTIFCPRFRAVIDSKNPTEISSAILREHLKNCNTLTPTPVHDALSLHDRLERIENLLQQPQEDKAQFAMNLTLNQQTAMIQEIRDAMFGEWEKINPEQNSDKRIIAKRTGLLMMAKFMSDWKDEYGPKVGRLEKEVCGKKGDINTGLVGTCQRVEVKVDGYNASVTALKQTVPENLLSIQKDKVTEEEDKVMMRKNWTLEGENKKLKAEIENLKAPITQEIAEANIEKEAVEEENIELKKQNDVLQDAVKAFQMELKEKDSTKHWADEAWDSAMDAYWPQGNLTFESGKAELKVEAEMSKPSPTTVEESGKPAITKASRGSGTGSVGACIVM
ncbi:hypothetical protein B0J14DRAFT_697866 [Halenospora varia]|nr:hypothetical protein B0J14DRAFT_697866 [Halenospora varia]